MSPLNITNRTVQRSLFILERLQHRLEDLLPTSKDFCKYRNQILLEEEEEDVLKSQKLLDQEDILVQEQSRLEEVAQKRKNNEKKKEFVDTIAKMKNCQRMLQNTRKQLNKILCKSKAVQKNGIKLQTTFGWLKQQLERNELEAYLLDNHGLITSTTAAEKKQNMMEVLTALQNEVAALKKRQHEVITRKIELAALSEATEQMENELRQNKTKVDNKKREMAEKVSSQARKWKIMENAMREEIVEISKDITGEKQIHLQDLSKYSEDTIQAEIENHKNKWKDRSQDLRNQLNDLIRKRDDGLKTLLELRLTWQQHYESRKKTEEEQHIRIKVEQELMDREYNAAKILQNKIRILYLSKLKATSQKANTKKKKVAKGKGKK